MVPRINEVGNRYGRLVVIEFAGIKNGLANFLCQCDCGNQKIIRGAHLRDGNTQSCNRCLPKGEASFNILYAQRKHATIVRNMRWNLSKDEFRYITSQDCYYCGSHPYQEILGDKCNGKYVYNGIDRVDNTKGYIYENCVPCCGVCNKMKLNHSVDNFKQFISKIYNHFVLG